MLSSFSSLWNVTFDFSVVSSATKHQLFREIIILFNLVPSRVAAGIFTEENIFLETHLASTIVRKEKYNKSIESQMEL